MNVFRRIIAAAQAMASRWFGRRAPQTEPPRAARVIGSSQRNPWRLKHLLGALDKIRDDIGKRNQVTGFASRDVMRLVTRIGVYVRSPVDQDFCRDLPLPDEIPAFGGVYLLNNDKHTADAVRFLAFSRQRRPPPTVAAHHDKSAVYVHGMFAVASSPTTIRWGAFYAAIVGQQIHLLPFLSTEKVPLPATARSRARWYSRQTWTSEYERLVWSQTDGSDEKPVDLSVVLHYAINLWRLQSAGWVIIADDGKTRLRFTVPQHRVVDFFRDRLREPAKDGKRRRIVHAVRPFQRVNGQTVRWHLRGAHNFRWHDWNCHIVVPGHQGMALTDLSTDTIELYDDEPRPSNVIGCNVTARHVIAAERRHAAH